MKEPETSFFIVESRVLPEIYLKVIKAKRLLETGEETTISDAVTRVGISRSAFYKYRESVFEFYENSVGRTVTIALNIDDHAGLLSEVLLAIAKSGANILTINQTIPLNGIANVTMTIETGKISGELASLIEMLQNMNRVKSCKIIARE